jgi:hypothetical protein
MGDMFWFWSLVGLNPQHSSICLDGPVSGCISPVWGEDRIVNFDETMQHYAFLDYSDVRTQKRLVCPGEKTRLRKQIGRLWDMTHWYDCMGSNCHQHMGEQGYPRWLW